MLESRIGLVATAAPALTVPGREGVLLSRP